MKTVFAALLLALAFQGCSTAQPRDWEVRSSAPTPDLWAVGSTWTLVLLDQTDAIVSTLTVRFSDQPAETCLGGEWKQLQVISELPPNPARDAHFGHATPAYLVKGAALMIELNGGVFCDNYHILRGQLTSVGVFGRHDSEYLSGAEYLGKFYGAPIQCQPGS